MVAVGEGAPDFASQDQDGSPFRLSSLRGAPVVLYFYPQADTPGCTMESKGFRDIYPQLRAKNVHVVGVSTDDCPAQKAFQKKYALPFPLVADRSKAVATQFGVLGPAGKARRVSFFLDGEGRVLEVVDASSADRHLARARARFL
jgi:thioredoxin-dependent peroxiredoxin